MADSKKYRQPTDVETGSVSADINEPLEVNSTSGVTGRIANESTLSDVLSRLQALDDALASVGADSLRTTLTGEPLDVSAATVPVEQQTPVGVENTGGTQVDPATEGTVDTVRSLLDELEDALQSVAGDEIRVRLQSQASALDVSAATVPVEQQTAVDVTAPTGGLDVSGATVTTTTDSTDAGPYQDRTTSTGTTISVTPGRFGGTVSIVVDATGSGTLTVGVSNDGGTTVDSFTQSYSSSGTNVTVPGYGYVEASANQNINAVSISAKGL